MDYIKIPLYLSGANATVDRSTSVTIGTAGSYGTHAFEIQKGRNWENLEVKATFYQKPDNGSTTTSPSDEVLQFTVIETAEDLIPVPSEILQVETNEPGSTAPETWVTFSGYEGSELKMNSLRLMLTISDTGPTYKDAYTVTPDMEEQLINVSREFRDQAEAAAKESKASAEASAKSAEEALESQKAAEVSEKNADVSADNALSSEMAAAKSETEAKISEDNTKEYYEKVVEEHDTIVEEVLAAVNSSSEAADAAKAAKQSASEAAESATNAASSAGAAKTSETNAKASEVAAGKSANTAKTHADAAKLSEQNAATSEALAKASETNAANSAKNASSSATTATNAASEANSYKELAKQYANSVSGVKEASEAAQAAAEKAAEAAAASEKNAENSKTFAQSYSNAAGQSATAASGYADIASAGASNASASALAAEKSAQSAASELTKVQNAGTSATNAINAAKEGAITAIDEAGDTAAQESIGKVQEAQAGAISAVSGAQSAAITNIQREATTQSGNIAGAASTAIGNVNKAVSNGIASINSKTEEKIAEVNAAGTSNVASVNQAGETQVDAIEAAGESQIGAITTAVSEGVTAVGDAKDDAIAEIDAANAKAPQINASTGYWQTWDSETGAYKDTTTLARGPQGIQGEKGKTGETGATPNFTIAHVNTMEPDDPAQVFIEGTPENPTLSFNIPRGQDGNVGPGVPTGGTTGQVVYKKSEAENDTEWGDLPVYSVEKQAVAEAGFLATYHLTKDGEQIGVNINIPKDFFVRSAELKQVTDADTPYSGAVAGDKYIDLVINTKEYSESDQHIYLPVKDLVDVYTEGNGVSVNPSKVISLKLNTSNSNGLGLDENGLKLDLATDSTPGAMSAEDKANIGKALKKDRYSGGSSGNYDAYMIDGQTTLQSDGPVVFYGQVDLRGTVNIHTTPTQPNHAVPKKYVDDAITGVGKDLPYIKDTGDFVVGDYDFTAATLSVNTPTENAHAATKKYVDDAITGVKQLPATTAEDAGKLLVVKDDGSGFELKDLSYSGSVEVSPTFENQTLNTAGKILNEDITIAPIKMTVTENESGGRTLEI